MFQVTFLRFIYKKIVHLVTGKCEVHRLLDQLQEKENLASRALLVEKSLLLSRNENIRSMVLEEPANIQVAVEKFLYYKKIDYLTSTSPCYLGLSHVLNQIHGYEKLFQQVDRIRRETYNSSNAKHEIMLQELWDYLQPNRKLSSRISKDWGDIGFQGEDPMTDFRGMGLLGLINLIYFSKRHNLLAMKALQHSQHPKYGYSYAIVGINITGMTYNLMSNGLLRTHFFNASPGLQRLELADFNEVYCYLFSQFDEFWMKSEPENIMAFGEIRGKFLEKIENQLICPQSALLKLNDISG